MINLTLTTPEKIVEKSTPTAREIGETFVKALAANDRAQLETVLDPEVGLRQYTTDFFHILRGLGKVVDHFQADFSIGPDTEVEFLSALGEEDRAAVEFRYRYTQDGEFREDFRSAFLHIRAGKIHTIDAYRTAPTPSARREGWIAPATLSEEGIGRLFVEWQNGYDLRDWIPPHADSHFTLRGGWGGSGDAHPGSNGTGGFRWPAEVADQKIEEMIERFRSRGIGFSWYVSPFDEPQDLAERLERHGLLLAGDHLGMARVGLAPGDIKINAEIEMEELSLDSPEASMEDFLQVCATGFNWTPEQIDERRPGMFERIRNPKTQHRERGYVARLNGKAVGQCVVIYKCGWAFMGGASVLAEARNQRVYSTMLARRLADAHGRGYHIAAIHAAPMSRPIVAKYGFKPYARFLIYGWMPEPDMDVIKSLVPQE